jgi:hypothetical protein
VRPAAVAARPHLEYVHAPNTQTKAPTASAVFFQTESILMDFVGT